MDDPSPSRNEYLRSSDVENSSLVVLLTTNGKRLLFTGDIKQQASEQLAQGWTHGEVDVFLVTHHGSAAGSPDKLLQVIDPRFAVISTRSAKIFKASTAARLKSHVDEAWWTSAGGQSGTCAGR